MAWPRSRLSTFLKAMPAPARCGASPAVAATAASRPSSRVPASSAALRASSAGPAPDQWTGTGPTSPTSSAAVSSAPVRSSAMSLSVVMRPVPSGSGVGAGGPAGERALGLPALRLQRGDLADDEQVGGGADDADRAGGEQRDQERALGDAQHHAGEGGQGDAGDVRG